MENGLPTGPVCSVGIRAVSAFEPATLRSGRGVVVDHLSKDARSAVMRAVRQRDTLPELLVRGAVHRLGLRFRLYRRDLPGTPDLVFPKYRTCVFVHGCFWHRHPGCRRASTPAGRKVFWEAKFRENVEHDLDSTARLCAMGWRVEVVWACETQRGDRLHAALRRVFPFLQAHERLRPAGAAGRAPPARPPPFP